jgi:hypothetical protein
MVSGRHGAIRGVLAEIRGFDVFERLRGWGKIILKWVARLRANDNIASPIIDHPSPINIAPATSHIILDDPLALRSRDVQISPSLFHSPGGARARPLLSLPPPAPLSNS